MVAPLLLIAALSVTASAARLPDCIHVSTSAARARWMPDLDAVRECQDKARQKLIDDAAAKGKPLSPAALDRIDDEARAQAREYLAKSGSVIEGLEKRLHAAAGDGKDGITPAMGRDMIDSLTKKQGFVSPDMKDLLDSVVRDGGKLTPETMKKLQGAGRAAKGAGLDLGIDPGTEKNLLEHDFDKDAPQKPEAPADPGNL